MLERRKVSLLRRLRRRRQRPRRWFPSAFTQSHSFASSNEAPHPSFSSWLTSMNYERVHRTDRENSWETLSMNLSSLIRTDGTCLGIKQIVCAIPVRHTKTVCILKTSLRVSSNVDLTYRICFSNSLTWVRTRSLSSTSSMHFVLYKLHRLFNLFLPSLRYPRFKSAYLRAYIRTVKCKYPRLYDFH